MGLSSLGCGGLWAEALAESFTEMSVSLSFTAPGPERDRVLAVLDEGFIQTRAGNVGLFELVAFEEVFETAIADGLITPVEATGLEAAAVQQDFPPVDPTTLTEAERQERATTLSVKRMLDEAGANDPLAGLQGTIVDTGSREPAPTAAIAGWDSRELTRRLAGADWAIEECHEQSFDGQRYVSCTANRDGAYATVTVTRYVSAEEARWGSSPSLGLAARRDGNEALVVSVYDSSRADKIGRSLLPASARVASLQQSAVQGALSSDGWTIDSCESFFDEYSEGFGCAMRAGDIVGSVDVYIDKEDDGGGPHDERTTSYGVAEVLQGNASMTVEILDGGAAERLVVALVDE